MIDAYEPRSAGQYEVYEQCEDICGRTLRLGTVT
jgi:hypothetical protein